VRCSTMFGFMVVMVCCVVSPSWMLIFRLLNSSFDNCARLLVLV